MFVILACDCSMYYKPETQLFQLIQDEIEINHGVESNNIQQIVKQMNGND